MRLIKFTFCFLIITLSSCDRLGYYDYYINNKSDSTVIITYKWLNKEESKVVAPHVKLLIDSFETNNNLVDEGVYFLHYFDTVFITVNNSYVKKDVNSRMNWDYTADKEAWRNIYVFDVENKDLQ